MNDMKHKILKAIDAWELDGHTWITGSQLEQAVTKSMVEFDLALYAQALSALVQSQILLVVGKSYATAYTYHLENEISVAVGKKSNAQSPLCHLPKSCPPTCPLPNGKPSPWSAPTLSLW